MKVAARCAIHEGTCVKSAGETIMAELGGKTHLRMTLMTPQQTYAKHSPPKKKMQDTIAQDPFPRKRDRFPAVQKEPWVAAVS